MSEQAKPEKSTKSLRYTRPQEFLYMIGSVGLVWGGILVIHSMGESAATNEIMSQLEESDAGNDQATMIIDGIKDEAIGSTVVGIVSMAVGTGAALGYRELRRQQQNEQAQTIAAQQQIVDAVIEPYTPNEQLLQ